MLLWSRGLGHWPQAHPALHAPVPTWGTSRQVESCAKLHITGTISASWEWGIFSLVSQETPPVYILWQLKETFLWHLRLAIWCKTHINFAKSHTNQILAQQIAGDCTFVFIFVIVGEITANPSKWSSQRRLLQSKSLMLPLGHASGTLHTGSSATALQGQGEGVFPSPQGPLRT